MSALLLRALGVADRSLPPAALGWLQQNGPIATALDGGYLLIDHYGEKGVRKAMEDECVVCASLKKLAPSLPAAYDFTVCGLFDGHGGRQCAAFAKEHLLREIGLQLAQYLEAAGDAGREVSETLFKKSVNAACCRLDTRIAHELPGCSDGCTALLLFVRGPRAFVLNLGDSAAYLCRRVDSVMHAIPLNEPHKAWAQREKERVLHYGGTVEGGRVNGVLEVTRSFGDLSLKRFGVLCTGTYRQATLDLGADEFVLMACDGFWGVFDAHEACRKTLSLLKQEEVRAGADPQRPFLQLRRVCKELVEHALTVKRAQDNISVVLVRFVRG